ncbi:4'-phosphopantetheinyl transferase family protein [Salinimicrobium sp. GXAS 041]|uniref:4'-phosphopantetheinyl transferase family protein n=1 Tax=Salinimicrobium sp. GXAS 041 TaxID=3400806 RepID=UPI003C7803ED
MIGNDVVDLQLAAIQSNWKRKGWQQKVFLEAEQELIWNTEKPTVAVWLLWSMKEAAYKAHQRHFELDRRLNWKILECRLSEFSEEQASGEVKIEGKSYFTTSRITLEAIHTTAVNRYETAFKNGIFKASSEEMKQTFLKLVSENSGATAGNIQLQKNGFGIPFLTLHDQELSTSFSFSGHGSYAAFSLALTNS